MKKGFHCVILFFGEKTGETVSPKHEGRIPMSNDTTVSKKVQVQIKKFSSHLARGLSKPKKRFLTQVIYGIQASRDIKLSNISRSLEEEIRLIKTENRLSRHITSKDLTGHINNKLIEEASWRIKEDTVLALDLSDINKPFGKKMEKLGHVWNGSEGEVGKGYWICEIIAAGVKEENPMPVYSELYSHEEEGFESENHKILNAVSAVDKHTKGRGIWTIDRGGDRGILVEELDKMHQRFVIRCVGSRDFKDESGRTKKVDSILKTIEYSESYKIEIDKEGYTETIELELGRRDNLWIGEVRVSLIVIKGFSSVPMLLITNVDKSPRELLEIYLTRWKCEESFRFLKHEYNLEDVRVRRYIALRNTVALVHAVFYFLSIYLGRSLKMKILLHKIIQKAKRFFQIPSFKHYAVADGIFRLLFNIKWDTGDIKTEEKDRNQLTFGFI